MDPVTVLGIGSILANVFGGIFGGRSQAKAAEKASQSQTQAAMRAAELEKQAFDEALAYQRELDQYQRSLEERDYRNYLARDQRFAPYRDLGSSAARTLLDYIQVPGMRPPDADAPMAPPMDSREPVNRAMELDLVYAAGDPAARYQFDRSGIPDDVANVIAAYQAEHGNPQDFRGFVEGLKGRLPEGYGIELLEHPSRLDKIRLTGPGVTGAPESPQTLRQVMAPRRASLSLMDRYGSRTRPTLRSLYG